MNGQRLAGQVEVLPVLRRDSDGRMTFGSTVLRETNRAWGCAVVLSGGGIAYPDDDDYEWQVKPLGVLRPDGDCSRCGQHGPLQDTAGALCFCVYCVPRATMVVVD